MPTVREHQVGEHVWYWLSVEFPTTTLARSAWEKLTRLPSGSVGVYRHGPADSPGRMLSAVSTRRPEVLRVARLLRGASDFDLDEQTLVGMILRRARVVTEAVERGQPTGRLKWRRPEDRGALLDPRTGDMIERPPGEG